MPDPNPTTEADDHDEGTGLVALIRQVPDLIARLIRDEVRATRAELVAKAKSAGLGAGLLVGAGIVAFFMLGALVAAGVLSLAGVFPGWLASLLVAAGLLILAALVGLLGVRTLKNGPTRGADDSKGAARTDREQADQK